ncbi:MAG: DUF4170 domain-containing protein [Alphaproteobacteria bacterium]
MTQYFVVGGEYDSTEFENLKSDEVRVGSYETFEVADPARSQLSWQWVDQCNARFVANQAKAEPMRCCAGY